MFYDLPLHSMFGEFIYFLKYKMLHKSILMTVAETWERVLRLNMTSSPKVKAENIHSYLKSHITKQLLTSISVDIRIYLPLKAIFTSA